MIYVPHTPTNSHFRCKKSRVSGSTCKQYLSKHVERYGARCSYRTSYMAIMIHSNRILMAVTWGNSYFGRTSILSVTLICAISFRLYLLCRWNRTLPTLQQIAKLASQNGISYVGKLGLRMLGATFPSRN